MLTSILSQQGIDLRSRRGSLLIIHSANQILEAVDAAMSTIPSDVFPRKPKAIVISLAKKIIVTEDQSLEVEKAATAAFLPPALLSEDDRRRALEVLRHLRAAGVIKIRDQRARFVHPVLAPLLVAEAYFEPLQSVWRSAWNVDDDPDNVHAQLRLAKVVLRSAKDRSGEVSRLTGDRPYLAAFFLAQDPNSTDEEISRMLWHLIHRIDSNSQQTEVVRSIESFTAFGDRCRSVCRIALDREKWLAVQLWMLLRCIARAGLAADIPRVKAIADDPAAPFAKEKEMEEEIRRLDRIVTSEKKDYYAARAVWIGKQAGRLALALGAGYLRAMDGVGRVPGTDVLDKAKQVYDHKPRVGGVEEHPSLEAEQERRRRLHKLRKRLPKVHASNELWAPQVRTAAQAALAEINARMARRDEGGRLSP